MRMPRVAAGQLPDGGSDDRSDNSIAPEAQPVTLDELARSPRPNTPRLLLAWSYARLAKSIRDNPAGAYCQDDLDLKDLIRYIRGGRVQFPGADSFANTAEKALAGNAAAYRFTLEWLDQHTFVRHKLDSARRRERDTERRVRLDA